MEDQLRGLKTRWEAQLPEPRTLASARRAAVEKRASQLTDRAHDALEDALAQQQLAFAALQSLVLNAPLHSHGREMFDALHFNTAMGADPDDRARQLRAHFARSVAAVPAAVARFTRLELADKPSLVPQSKVSVMGGADHTLVSSVFVSEIPCRSLERVFDAARAYFNGLPSAVKRHLGTDMDRQVGLVGSCDALHWSGDTNTDTVKRVLYDDMVSLSRADRQNLLDAELGLRADDYVQYRRTTIASAALAATANTVVCASLRETHAVFHVDVIKDDAQHPFRARETPRYAVAGLTLEPSDARAAVTLRLAIVYRYERLPQDPAVEQELRAHRAILNGDLLMASLCQHLREQQP